MWGGGGQPDCMMRLENLSSRCTFLSKWYMLKLLSLIRGSIWRLTRKAEGSNRFSVMSCCFIYHLTYYHLSITLVWVANVLTYRVTHSVPGPTIWTSSRVILSVHSTLLKTLSLMMPLGFIMFIFFNFSGGGGGFSSTPAPLGTATSFGRSGNITNCPTQHETSSHTIFAPFFVPQVARIAIIITQSYEQSHYVPWNFFQIMCDSEWNSNLIENETSWWSSFAECCYEISLSSASSWLRSQFTTYSQQKMLSCKVQWLQLVTWSWNTWWIHHVKVHKLAKMLPRHGTYTSWQTSHLQVPQRLANSRWITGQYHSQMEGCTQCNHMWCTK